MTKADSHLESLLQRDRRVVLMLLICVILVSWGYLISGAGMNMSAPEMSRLSAMDGSQWDRVMQPTPWTPGYGAVMFFMWWVMMIAMMLPGAIPMILLFAALQRQQRKKGHPAVATTFFTASYLLAWAVFSLAATLLHWFVDQTGLLNPGMAVTSQMVSAAILIGAGLYQLTPLKQACLRHCQMPAIYLARHRRPGTRGAFMMGFGHGTYCLGCCWALMLLLFSGGVMNLYWIAGLAIYVALEKSITAGHWLDYGLGATLTTAGLWLLIT